MTLVPPAAWAPLGPTPAARRGGSTGPNGLFHFPLTERNAYTGPTIWNLDFRLSRRFWVREKMNIEFLAEAFNILNRTQFTGISNSMYTLSGSNLNYNTAFGTINEAGGTLYR